MARFFFYLSFHTKIFEVIEVTNLSLAISLFIMKSSDTQNLWPLKNDTFHDSSSSEVKVTHLSLYLSRTHQILIITRADYHTIFGILIWELDI